MNGTEVPRLLQVAVHNVLEMGTLEQLVQHGTGLRTARWGTGQPSTLYNLKVPYVPSVPTSNISREIAM